VGRAFHELEAMLNELRATGLPVELVRDMGHYSWKQQVALMAGTGIFIATHGAASTNIMFMPWGSVFIEGFSYLMNVPMYAHLAHVSNVYYHQLRSLRPDTTKHKDEGAFALVDEDAFISSCENPDHVSSFDACECGWCGGCVWQYLLAFRTVASESLAGVARRIPPERTLGPASSSVANVPLSSPANPRRC
jgi:hypothetical protein